MPDTLLRITDVSPRDGLQNEPGVIPTAQKLQLIASLLDSGVDEIEATSFVSPKWVPQLGDAAELCEAMAGLLAARSAAGLVTFPKFSALVPNEKGLVAALEANARAKQILGADSDPLLFKVSVFTAASEMFSQRNTNATIAQTIERFVPVVSNAHQNGLVVRGYVSCAIACPFEGPIAPENVRRVVEALLTIGVDEVDLGDTIGAATVESTRSLLECVYTTPDISKHELTLHLHDTFGKAGQCAAVAYDAGVRSFDAAIGGLGGCPYAGTKEKPAPGNIDTRVLLAALTARGGTHAASNSSLVAASAWADKLRGRGR